MRILPTLAVFSLALLPGVRADDYLGADAVLKQVDSQFDAAQASARKGNPVRQFRLDLKSYREHAAGQSPDETARDWLALFDRALKFPPGPFVNNDDGISLPTHLREVFQLLPPPPAWDDLAARIATRPLPEKGSADFSGPTLRLLAGMLQGKPEAVRQAVAAFKQQADDAEGPQRDEYRQSVSSLEETVGTMIGDHAGALASFEAKLARLQPGKESSDDDRGRMLLTMNSLEVPDLVTLAGPARAEALLRQLFVLPVHDVDVHGTRTRALARQVALATGDQLKFPPWNLADTLDSTALYELLDRRNANRPEDQYSRQEADAYYLLGLLVQRRYDDAAALALKLGRSSPRGEDDALGRLPEDALGDLAAKGYAKEVYTFFDHLLAAHPELSYWKSYTAAAVLAHETDAMLARVKAAGEHPDLKPLAKGKLRAAYGDALLAADHVSEALPILREAMAAAPPPAANVPGGGEASPALEAALALARIGHLLGDDALANEGLDAVVKLLEAPGNAMISGATSAGNDLGEVFLSVHRGPDLERLIAAGLSRTRREVAAQRAQDAGAPDSMGADGSYGSRQLQGPLDALVDLYYRAGRYQDIVALLDHARDWGVADLAAMLTPEYGTGDFGYQAARALQKTGHADAALRLVNAYLENNGGSDPAYALLLELLPPDQAEARLDELFQGDQFEERPLIWRAVLQLGQNRLDEAERSARQAIGIDPSDGEEGRGDRMRAYAVLGDILERKGDKEKAEQMRQAVRAIRLSEDADRFHAAGLLTRAVGMYEKALGYFADAYCIQSRLAIQLTALGQLDEAMTHYERAYELMPDSFGRMESHCFGCERAFAGERAQRTAERVFQRLVAQQPDNPRVHYLLGYLRGEQERNAEAAHEYREAVRLDPDYINAWKQLASATDDPADRDHAALNLLRLDPRHKHDSADLSTVGDLRALWAAVEAANKFALPPPADIYPLAASKAFLEQERQRHPPKPADGEDPAATNDSRLTRFLNPRGERLTPWSAILKNAVIVQTLPFLSGNNDGANPAVSSTDD